MKIYFLTLISLTSFLCCTSKKAASDKTDTFSLQTLVFHSSGCMGACPAIDINIDSNRNIEVSRRFYKGRNKMDSLPSGFFSGVVNTEYYNKLMQLLQSCKIDSLKFPDIDCCDGAIITIIVYHNNKRIYLKSMEPSGDAYELISFLTNLGTGYPLKRVTEIGKIEE